MACCAKEEGKAEGAEAGCGGGDGKEECKNAGLQAGARTFLSVAFT